MKAIGSSSLIALLFAATFVAPAAASATPARSTAAMSPGYMSSEPSDGEMLDEAPDRVEVTFDEPLDESSVLTVTDECGRKIDDGEVDVQANTMSVGIALKPIGTYDVDYFAKGVGGVTGQESGTFDFMVHSGPSCGKKADGDHNNHGGNKGSGNHGSNHGGNHNGGDGGYNGGGHSGSGNHDGGTDHGSGSTDHGSTSGGSHSSTGHAGSGGATHDSGKNDSGKHRSGKHASGKHGSGKHASGKHGSGKHGAGHGAAGAHGLLDILEENEREEERSLAAGPAGLTAPDGQAVAMALALSLLMGVIGGWFLRVSGAR